MVTVMTMAAATVRAMATAAADSAAQRFIMHPVLARPVSSSWQARPLDYDLMLVWQIA